MAGKNDDQVRCSFCNKTQNQVRKLIAGPNGAYICDECVDVCAEIIEEEFEYENGREWNPFSDINLLKPEEIKAFLETFFKLYPTATEKELAYYVSGNVIEPIGRDYLYSELVNPIFTKDGDNVKVKVAVKFIDNQTKATQVSQYELVLQKDSNWKIVE